jgi:hypothetical protein
MSELRRVHIYRASFEGVEEVPTQMETVYHGERDGLGRCLTEQRFDPPITIGAGDEVLDWPPITITFE